MRRFITLFVTLPLASLLAFCLAVLLTTSFAHAAPAEPLVPPASVDEGEPTDSTWYGGRMLLVDALSVGLLWTAAANDVDGLAQLGLAGMFLGGPVVHITQGKVGRAFGSLGLRVGLPLTAAVAFTYMHDRQNRNDGECDCMGGVVAAFAGGMLGLGAAMLIDDIGLAWKSVPRDNPVTTEISLAPAFGVARGVQSLGLAGRF
jgi:hypothetical protein